MGFDWKFSLVRLACCSTFWDLPRRSVCSYTSLLCKSLSRPWRGSGVGVTLCVYIIIPFLRPHPAAASARVDIVKGGWGSNIMRLVGCSSINPPLYGAYYGR